MASNPLYPGYVPNPKDDPIHPLYPGYFPGQAEVRLPRGPDIKPNEFNFDQITQLIDQVSANYMLAGPDLPKWVIERAVDDFKQNLKASIRPADVNQEDLDDYDVNSLPGAFGLNVNLNPMDWIEDPKKTATKTVQGWWKSGVNWKDIETRYRVEAWRQVFNENAPGTFDFGGAEELGVSMLGTNLGAAVGLKYEKTANPLSLKGRAELEVPAESLNEGTYAISDIQLDAGGNVKKVSQTGATLTGTSDLGQKFATSLQEFEVMGGFGPKREEKFDKVAYNGYKTVVTEMEKHGEAISQVASNTSHAAALSAARARLNIYENMDGIGEALGDYLKDTRKNILQKKELFLGNEDRGLLHLNETIKSNLASIDAEITRLANSANPLEKAEAEFIKLKYVDNYKKQVESVQKQQVLQMAQEVALDPTKKTVIEAQIKAMNAKGVVNSLSGNIEGGFLSRSLSKGQPFAPSIQRIFLRDTLQDVDRPGLRGSIAIGHLVSDVVHADPAAASQIIRGAINFTRNEAQTMGAMEVMDSIDKGEFMEKYIWPRVKTYWSASTPGAYADRFMKRNHYFGVTLADSDDKEFEKSALYKASNFIQQPLGGLRRADKVGTIAATSKNVVPNAIYGNWFTVKGNGGIAGASISAKLYGGDQFDAVGKLNSMIGKGLGVGEWSAADFEKLLEVKDINDLLALDGRLRAAYLASGLTYIPKSLPKGLSAGDKNALEGFATGIGKFKKWVDENEQRVLATGVTKGSTEYYVALIKLLNDQNTNADYSGALSITRRYAGHLQKLFYKLNTTQSAVLKKFGKYLAPVAYARKAVVDFLASLVTKALQAIGGAASGGTLAAIFAALEPFIRFAINFVVGKALEIGKVFYDAVVKADLDSVFKYIDRTVEKYAKVVMGIIGAYTILIVIPAEKVMGTFAVSFSPVDNTITSGIKDNFTTGGFHSGTGVEVPPLASKPSSVDGFQYLDYDRVLISGGESYTITPWPSAWVSKFDVAIEALQATTGGYIKRLSDPAVGGLVNLVWAEPGNGGFCGLALGKDAFTGNDTIVFGHGNCYDGFGGPDWYYNYLFAHETAHIYNYRLGFESFDGLGFDYVDDNGEGTLTTYIPNDCSNANNADEDFADTLGNWVQLNTYDCAIPADANIFWFGGNGFRGFSQHYEYADKVLTRP